MKGWLATRRNDGPGSTAIGFVLAFDEDEARDLLAEAFQRADIVSPPEYTFLALDTTCPLAILFAKSARVMS